MTSIRPCTSTTEELPFQVWFDGDRLHLAGCVDTFCADRLAAVLATTPVGGPVVVLDLGDLEFIDAAGTRVIARWVERLRTAATAVHLVRAPRYFQRVWHLLGFDQAPAAAFGEPVG